jgi:MFS family permease
MSPTPRRLGPFVLLEAATVMSGSGNGVVLVVLPWLALERTGSAASAGIVASASAVPLLFAGLFAGSIVDRVGRRRAAIVSDLLSGVSVALVPIVDHTFGLDLGWLIALAVLGAFFDPAGLTAREALLPDVAGAARLRLERVNGVHEAVWGIAFLLGPGIGGVLIATVGAVDAMWAAAVGFVVSAVLVAIIRLPGLSQPPPHASPGDISAGLAPEARPGIWAETKEGIALVWRDRLLRDVGLLTLGLFATYLPIEGVLLPTYFEGQDAPERLGVLIMAMSTGGIVGALGYSAWGHRVGRRRMFVSSLVASGATVSIMAMLPPYPVLLVVGAMLGLAYGPVSPMVNLAIQLRTPEQARGRATGLLNSVGYAAGPVGYLLVGPFVEWFGLEATFVIVGLAVLAVALLAIPLRGLHEFDGLSSVAGHVSGALAAPQTAPGSSSALPMSGPPTSSAGRRRLEGRPGQLPPGEGSVVGVRSGSCTRPPTHPSHRDTQP